MQQPTLARLVLSSVAALALAGLLTAPAALAAVNHGDFLGVDVDFLQVTETTLTADPEPLWEAPVLAGTGNALEFNPTAFTSVCNAGIPSDTTESTLVTTLVAAPGQHIQIVALQELGDAILTQFPPFGDPSTNATAAVSGTVTVTETTSGPITPVVIPFTGTFVPSDTFALPGNFGANTWTGTVSVDVEAQVPLATVAEVSITNSLATNCGPSGIANLQKKVVSGPTVALMVNPLECELQLDKTCCVTQPGLPDFGQCEGDMISMTLEFTGDKCSRSNNDQGRSFKCWGRRKIKDPADIFSLDWHGNLQITPNQNVNHGDEVTFTSSTGTLGNKTRFKVKDDWWRKQYLKINTSCEKAFECGDQFGAFKVVGFESTEGGVVDCNGPPPPPVCAVDGDPVGTPCDGKIVDFVVEYNGRDCQDPLPNPQNGEASCDGDATGATNVGIQYVGYYKWQQHISPSSMINDGDRIRISATYRGGCHRSQKYLITDSSGVLQKLEFDISCDEPLALGDEFGSFKVVEMTTKYGTRVALGDGDDGPKDQCEVPLAPEGPHCTGDLTELTLVYIGDFLGEGCTVSNSQYGYGTCSGVDDPGDPVALTVLEPGVEAIPDVDIEFGDLVTFTDDSDGDLPWRVLFDTTGAGGTQQVQIKTSCYKPLSLGDRFGSWVVFGMTRDDDGPISLGGNVQYQYAVTNPNADPVGNVAINDSELGEIVSGVTLASGETQTFVQNATLFGTTTNVATATGDINGDVCDPGVDQVTVDVTAPPQGAFSCSDPIIGLTMTWNGSETVKVEAWTGDVGTSTLAGTYMDVTPGTSIEVTGLGANGMNSTWQIFTQDGSTLLGESTFNLWCHDKAMNGVEDCGKAQGDGKYNDPQLLNDWILEGLQDGDESLSCSPSLVPNPPDCGFGPELLLVLPGLMWAYRRRNKRD